MPRAIRVLVAVFLLVLTFGALPAILLGMPTTPVFASEAVYSADICDGGDWTSVAAATARSGVIATAGSLSGAITDIASFDDNTVTTNNTSTLEAKGGKFFVATTTGGANFAIDDTSGAITTAAGSLPIINGSNTLIDYGLGFESLTTMGVSATLSGTRSIAALATIDT